MNQTHGGMMESEDMQNLKFCGEMPWGRTSPYRYYKTEMNGKHDCFVLNMLTSIWCIKLSMIETILYRLKEIKIRMKSLFLILSIELYSFILRDANSNL